MPGSAITAGCVDFVLPPERIAQELARLAGHPYVAPVLSRGGSRSGRRRRRPFERSCAAAPAHGGGFHALQTRHAAAAHPAADGAAQAGSLKDYVRYLRSHPAEVKELYSDILIHVTGFFRDPACSSCSRRRSSRGWSRARRPEEPVRVWVPGCSTGEEAYSLAIALLEYMGERKASHPVQIFGTDINDTALERGPRGHLPREHRGRGLGRAPAAVLRQGRARLPDQQDDPRAVHLRPAERGGGPAVLEPRPDQLPQRADLPGRRPAAQGVAAVPLRAAARRLPAAGASETVGSFATCSRWWTRRPRSMPRSPPARGPRSPLARRRRTAGGAGVAAATPSVRGRAQPG